MAIIYKEQKDLPSEQLYALFRAVGWAGEDIPDFMLQHFNEPFLQSSHVVSAWDETRLIGCARALTDGIIRAILWDVAVLPEYQGRGIGRAMVEKCIARYPAAQWLLCTIPERMGFYEKLGFSRDDSIFMSIPCVYFDTQKENKND